MYRHFDWISEQKLAFYYVREYKIIETYLQELFKRSSKNSNDMSWWYRTTKISGSSNF